MILNIQVAISNYSKMHAVACGLKTSVLKPAATTKREDSTESWTVVDEANEKEKNPGAAADSENAKAGEVDTAKKSVGVSEDEGGDGWDEWE